MLFLCLQTDEVWLQIKLSKIWKHSVGWNQKMDYLVLGCQIKKNVISLVRWRKIWAPPLPKKYNVRSLDFHFSALSLSHGEINGKQGHHQCNEKGYFFLLWCELICHMKPPCPLFPREIKMCSRMWKVSSFVVVLGGVTQRTPYCVTSLKTAMKEQSLPFVEKNSRRKDFL